MELYIRLKDGKPFGNPILGENFRAAFPDIDTNNLPSDFLRFERVAVPTLGPYDVHVGVTYKIEGNVCKDVHHVRSITDKEKADLQDMVKQDWAKTGFASWLFDEESCSFKPPAVAPNDGKRYHWDEASLSWLEV